MRKLRFLVFGAVVIVIFFLSCAQLLAPSVNTSILTYSAEIAGYTPVADITYRGSDNDIISLTGQSLPWSIDVELVPSFTGEAYLRVNIPQSEIFIPYLTGTATAALPKRLIDNSADFNTNGLVVGDIVYADPSAVEYAEVTAIESANTLFLNADLFASGDTYNIYHRKTLSAKIIVNGVTIKEENYESEKLLSCNLLSTVNSK